VGFAGDRDNLLLEFLSLENGLPSHDTFSRLFRLPDPQAFGRAFGAVLEDLGTDGLGGLAIDGKTLRRPFDPAACRRAATGSRRRGRCWKPCASTGCR
jgi:hypothetical protein